jgi:hypothetical protein
MFKRRYQKTSIKLVTLLIDYRYNKVFDKIDSKLKYNDVLNQLCFLLTPLMTLRIRSGLFVSVSVSSSAAKFLAHCCIGKSMSKPLGK